MLRPIIGLGVLLALIVAAAWFGPRLLSTVTVPDRYNDFRDVEGFNRYRTIPVRLDSLELGAIVVWRTGNERMPIAFGRVAGLPGQRIDVRGGMVHANGIAQKSANLTDLPGVIVPAGTLYAVSDANRFASQAAGMIPEALLIGKVEHFP